MGVLSTSFHRCFYTTILVVIAAADRSVFSTPQPPPHLDVATSACKRLIADAYSQTEVVPLIEVTFASQDEIEMIDHLWGDDAQTFIDVMDKVRSYIHSPLGFVLIILFASDTI